MTRYRITESKLRNAISESVRIALNEKHRPRGVDSKGKRVFRKNEKGKRETFYPVSDLKRYANAQGLGTKEMYKVGTVDARPAQSGRTNSTTLQGGFKERDDFSEKEGQMIVRNPRGEQYPVENGEFFRKYSQVPNSVPDKEGYQKYNVYDKRNISDPIKHNIVIDKPDWGPGQKQYGRKNDAHVVNPGTDNYFIGHKELQSTHTSKKGVNDSLSRMIRNIVNEAIEDLGNGFRYNPQSGEFENDWRTERDKQGIRASDCIPSTCDDVVIAVDNNRDCMEGYENMGRTLARRNGRPLDIETLANSAMMKYWQQHCFNVIGKSMDAKVLKATSPSDFRYYFAERLIDEVREGQWG